MAVGRGGGDSPAVGGTETGQGSRTGGGGWRAEWAGLQLEGRGRGAEVFLWAEGGDPRL